MGKIQLKVSDLSLVELTARETEQINGGSLLSYGAGWLFGATVGLAATVVAAATLAVTVIVNTSGGVQEGMVEA